jgi:hypothetical protein
MLDCLANAPKLITLEPLLGVSLTLNLAYLNIGKFEYIRQVRKIVKIKLDRLDPNVKSEIKDTKWFTQLESLANLDTDEDLPLPRNSFWLQAPSFWGFLYNLLFYWPIGRLVSMVSAIYCLFLLILSVGYESGGFSLLACHYSGSSLAHVFGWVVASLIWPLAMISAGSFIGLRANAFVNYQTDQLKTKAALDAQAALSEVEDTLKMAKPKLPLG